MKILFLSDLHDINIDNLEKINNLTYDICILLGDIPKKGLDIIKTKIKSDKLYGITGNHEDSELLKRCGITDISFQLINIDNLSFYGIPGSVRYKRGMYSMFTQEEMSEKIKNSEKCDILISHESGFHYVDTDMVHEGFIAIDKYIKTLQPKYNVFGHHHKQLYFKKYNTNCICIYQCSVLDTDTEEIINIF